MPHNQMKDYIILAISAFKMSRANIFSEITGARRFINKIDVGYKKGPVPYTI
jgi:hypothetical protein